ncbi:hypothetical protein A2U01_0068354 [Trifolium medium]|uniref:Uncharacterized protein n=1 Tax=Trifolium medium TaxID=97028 RepID=A0A392SDT8_9FABA|nr:hypothetical protein [Trifolium medium]
MAIGEAYKIIWPEFVKIKDEEGEEEEDEEK